MKTTSNLLGSIPLRPAKGFFLITLRSSEAVRTMTEGRKPKPASIAFSSLRASVPWILAVLAKNQVAALDIGLYIPQPEGAA